MPDDLAARLANVASTGSSTPTVSGLQAADVPATHEVGPSGITPKGGDLATRVASVAAGKPSEPPAPTLTPEQTLSRTNANMTAAMSGQQMPNPEDQQGFDEGKKAGTIQGGVDIGASAVLGPALEFLGMGGKAAKAAAQAAPEAQKVGTGLLDQFGNEIFREIPAEAKQAAWKILQHPAVEAAIKKVVKDGVVKSGAKLAGGGLASWGVSKLGDQVLHWLLSD